jgi:hypothetical protein
MEDIFGFNFVLIYRQEEPMYHPTRGLLRTPLESYFRRQAVMVPNGEGRCLTKACKPNKPQIHGPDMQWRIARRTSEI